MTEIRQRISLEGGKEVKRELDDLGNAGASAFKKLQNAAAASGALNALNAIVAKGQQISGAFGNLANAAGHFGEAAGRSLERVAIATGLAGGSVFEVVKSFAELIKSSAKADDELLKTAETLGITVKSLSNLQFAAGQAGIDTDKLTSALVKLERAMGDAAKRSLEFSNKTEKIQLDAGRRQQDLNTSIFRRQQDELEARRLDVLSKSGAAGEQRAKEIKQEIADNRARQDSLRTTTRALEDLRRESDSNTDAFTRLGIKLTDSDGELRKVDEVMLDLADAFKEMEDGPKKAALALELFGKGNARMIPFLNAGREGIKRFNEEANRVAPPPDKLELIANRTLSDSFDSLEKAAASAKNSILSVFSPLLTDVVEAFTESIVANRTTLVLFAGTIAEKVKPLVEQLIHALESGEAAEFLIKATNAAIGFGVAVKNAVNDIIIPAFNGLMTVLRVVAEAINGLFGTNLTGGELGIVLVLGKLLGLFPLLAGAVQLAVAAFGLLATLLGGPLAAALAIIVGIIAVRLVQALIDVDWAGWGRSALAVIDSIKNWFFEKFDAMIAKARQLKNAVLDSLPTWLGGNSQAEIDKRNQDTGFAGGGHVRGRGTGTSDSIWARVSNGEYVLRAAAVRRVGVGFLNALNRAGEPLSALMHRFSSGGLLDLGALMPRPPGYANGGMVTAGGGGRPLTFILDGRSISGLTGNQDAVSQLVKHSTRSSLGSAGRKPSWYR